MSEGLYFVFNLVMISLAQLFLACRYAKERAYAKAIHMLILLGILVFLLLCGHRFAPHIPGLIISLSLLTVIGHFLLGISCGLYYRSATYDRWLHACGAFSFSLLIFSVLHYAVSPFTASRLYVSLFVGALGLSLGALFEIAEFIADRFTKGTPNQHGLADTNFDLLFGLFGAVLAAFAAPHIL